MGNTFQDRLDAVRARIKSACDRCGRRPEDITLIAVSKTYGPERVKEAADCGLRIFGENKVQEAQAKIPLCASNLSWHLVGHLQRNKVKRAVPIFDMIHSVDSLKLLETIDRVADECGKVVPVLIEINVSGEGSKFGLAPDRAPELLTASNRMNHVEARGLMTLPPLTEDPAKARPYFVRLREWRDRWKSETGIELAELSMGMTNDFEVAIEEGATIIRIGTALFGEREKHESSALE